MGDASGKRKASAPKQLSQEYVRNSSDEEQDVKPAKVSSLQVSISDFGVGADPPSLPLAHRR